MTAVASVCVAAAHKHRVSLERSLRLYRTEQAFIRTVPATSIFGNKLLHDIAASKPTTVRQLMGLRGMGARRCKWYGPDIIRLVGMSSSAQPRAPGASAPRRAAKKLRGAPKQPRPAPKKPGGLARCKGRPRKWGPSLPAPRPRPKPKPKPRPRPRPGACAAPASALWAKAPPQRKTSVYILELQDGRVYVGSSADIDRRVAQHAAGQGSAYTRAYRPTGVLLPRLGNVSGDGDAAERDETLRYMFQRGIPFVRGWKFTQVAMPPEEFDEAEANIRELYDLCRRCGFKGHFICQCRATYDRWGKPCEA